MCARAASTKPAEPLIYWCGFNGYWPDPFFLVRSAALQPASMAAIRAALHEIEPDRAVYAAQPLSELMARSLTQRRLATLMLTLFAVTAYAARDDGPARRALANSWPRGAAKSACASRSAPRRCGLPGEWSPRRQP